jgi:hypothetical protein
VKHTIDPFARSLETTQYALEQNRRLLEKLAQAHNVNGRHLKDAEIQLNLRDMELQRLQERMERRASE